MCIKSSGLAILYIAVFITRSAYALIVPFGPNDLKIAGDGCVAGYTSDGARIAYYSGNTDLLNVQLKAVIEQHPALAEYIVRLHGYTHVADAPEEGIASHRNKQISVDWSISEQRVFRSLESKLNFLDSRKEQFVRIPFRQKPEVRVVVNIWQSESVDIVRLSIPGQFIIERVTERAN